MTLHLILVTPDLADNSLGRTYCLWLLARANGWDVDIIAPSGDEIWGPLANTDFAGSCSIVSLKEVPAFARTLARASRLIIGVKAVPASTLIFERLLESTGLPGFIDIDDPDLEARLPRSRLRGIGRQVLKPKYTRALRKTRLLAETYVGTVSNPLLADRYGGRVLPHVREGIALGRAHESRHPVIAFVGTNRRHKGVDVLRRSVSDLQSDGFTLVVTDVPPDDGHPWETWLGATTLADGIRVVQDCDIVVIPSLASPWSSAQLPVKLLDAMLAGRAVIVSNVGPLPWAIGDAGLTVEPGSVSSLTDALRTFRDPTLRTAYGDRARAVALKRYSVEAQKAAFRSLCQAALDRDK